MNTFFTSDTHHSHGNIIKYSGRLFCLSDEERSALLACPRSPHGYNRDDVAHIHISKESVARHNQVLTDNWNSVVTNDDIVYHLGDVSFAHPTEIEAWLNSLNFRELNLIRGNHDKNLLRVNWRNVKRPVNLLGEQKKVRIATIFKHEQKIVLNHYALRVWDESHRGSWHLYGHSHGSLPDDPNSLSFDVGVDCHNFTPLSFDQVREIMAKKTHRSVDHHA